MVAACRIIELGGPSQCCLYSQHIVCLASPPVNEAERNLKHLLDMSWKSSYKQSYEPSYKSANQALWIKLRTKLWTELQVCKPSFQLLNQATNQAMNWTTGLQTKLRSFESSYKLSYGSNFIPVNQAVNWALERASLQMQCAQRYHMHIQLDMI